MSRPKTVVKIVRVGLTNQLYEALKMLANKTGELPQTVLIDLLKEKWEKQQRLNPSMLSTSTGSYQEETEEDQTERINRIIDAIPEEDHKSNGKALVYLSAVELKKWCKEMEEKYGERIPPKPVLEEAEKTIDIKPVSFTPTAGPGVYKRLRAVTWEVSNHPSYKGQKLFAKIIIVEPHKLAELSRSKTAKILRTKEEVARASQEVAEINEWVEKKKSEYRKKYPSEGKFNSEWDKLVGTFSGSL